MNNVGCKKSRLRWFEHAERKDDDTFIFISPNGDEKRTTNDKRTK